MKRRKRAHPVHVVDVVRALVGAQEGVWRRRGRTGTQTVEVFEAFTRLGAPLTEQAEPVGFKRGVLTLQVARSAWLTELSMLSERITERINDELGESRVRDIRLRLGSVHRPPPPKIAPTLSARQEAVVQTTLEPIEDDALRSAVERAARRSLVRDRRGQPAEGPPGPRVCPPGPVVDPDEEPPLTYGYGDRTVDRWQGREPDRWKKKQGKA